LEIESVRPVAGEEVYDAALTESGERRSKGEAYAMKATLRIHDVVYQLTVLRLRRGRRQNPEIAVEVRLERALTNGRIEIEHVLEIRREVFGRHRRPLLHGY